MNSKIVCFASSKGGAGKSILTANIASFLTEIGKKCLIIDCDAATHGLTLLYLVNVSRNKNIQKKGVFDISNLENLSEVLKQSIVEVENGVDLIPATYNFKAGFDPEENFNEWSIKNIVSILKSKYDLILLDAQAGSDKYSKLVMSKEISQEVVIVSEYDPLSAAGIERLKQVIGEDLDYTRTWVLLNKMLPEFVDNFSEFLSVTKYLPPIPWDALVVRAYAKNKLALDLERGNAFTLSIMRVVNSLFGEKVEIEIKEWSDNRSYALKAPVEKQYQNAEKELQFMLEAKNQLELKIKRKRLLRLYAFFLPLMLIPIFIYFEKGLFFSNSTILKVVDKSVTFEALTMLIIILIPILFTFSSKLLSLDKTAESIRYDRQISLLEEQLKKMETLRKADFETIVKSKDI